MIGQFMISNCQASPNEGVRLLWKDVPIRTAIIALSASDEMLVLPPNKLSPTVI